MRMRLLAIASAVLIYQGAVGQVDSQCDPNWLLHEVLPDECPELARTARMANCIDVECCAYCASDGECNTDNSLQNCFGYNLHFKHCADCPPDAVAVHQPNATAVPATEIPTTEEPPVSTVTDTVIARQDLDSDHTVNSKKGKTSKAKAKKNKAATTGKLVAMTQASSNTVAVRSAIGGVALVATVAAVAVIQRGRKLLHVANGEANALLPTDLPKGL
eukprot:m.33712 g.33712  ORF g.33712 m.33712 type:complete len:218 (-) comp12588_c0_seq2:71-724(-)